MQSRTEHLIHLTDDPGLTSNAERSPAFHRTLRVALAMKGGVSLAVWIGGAVAEFDILRRIRIFDSPTGPDAYLVKIDSDESPAVVDRARAYSEMMISARIDQIEFDVLAGASAGGLNAVLFGVAQRAGVRFDAVLQTWLTAGSIWRLIRTPWAKNYTSVLDGDHFFFEQVRSAIETLRAMPASEEHEARAVAVELSGTMVDADSPAEWGFQEGRAHFRFTGRKLVTREPAVAGAAVSPRGREIPGPAMFSGGHSRHDRAGSQVDVAAADKMNAAAIDRLAYAARTTSSFPGAFEPARILSRPVGDPGRPNPPEPFIDFDYAFSHHRAPEVGDAIDRGWVRPFRAIDGGVADNIPIDRALRVVRQMPAEDYVSRAIVYLEPDPAKLAARERPPAATVPPAPDEPPARIARMMDNVRNSLRLRGVRESGDEEIDQLERFRRERFLWQGRKRSFASLMIGYKPAEAHAAYSRYRSAADLSLLSDALSDPAVWQLGTDLVARDAVYPAPRLLLVELEGAIFQIYDPARVDGTFDEDAILRGPQAVLDAASCALAWMRELETIHFDQRSWFSNTDEAERVRVRQLINDVAAAARTSRDRAVYDAIHVSQDSHRARTAVDAWLAANHSKISYDHWDALWDAITVLGKLSGGLGARATTDVPWTHFLDVTGITAQDLAPFTAPIGIPMPMSNLTFDVIAATEPGQWDADFRTLQLAQSVELAEQWMSLNTEDFDKARVLLQTASDPAALRQLHPLTKLAGTNLWNFGAFFSARWRANDWWWGRLDGAAGLVRILGGMGILDGDTVDESGQRAQQIADTVRRAQASVLQEVATSPLERPLSTSLDVGESRSSDPGAIARRITSGAHRLRNLSAGYLVAVSSRVARASLRAARTGRGSLGRVLITALLPPLLVNLPFAVVPVRAVFLGLVVAAVVAIVASDTPVLPEYMEPGVWIGTIATSVAGALLAFAIVRGAVTLRRASRRRSTVVADIAGDENDALARHLRLNLRARAGRARRVSWSIWAVAVFAFVAAIVLTVAQGAARPGAWCIAGVAAGALIASARCSRRLDAPRPDGSSRPWLIASVVPTLVILFSNPIASALTQPGPSGIVGLPRTWWVPSLVASVGLLAAITLTQGWLPARRSHPDLSGRPGNRVARVSQWVGYGGRTLWVLMVLATAGVTGFAAWATMHAFLGTSILTQPAAAAILAWFFGAHTLWWLSERASSDDPLDVDDEPRDDTSIEAEQLDIDVPGNT
jgi:predicted acylesterase/phospholipase RssA